MNDYLEESFLPLYCMEDLRRLVRALACFRSSPWCPAFGAAFEWKGGKSQEGACIAGKKDAQDGWQGDMIMDVK
jgi:hypothetical protein